MNAHRTQVRAQVDGDRPAHIRSVTKRLDILHSAAYFAPEVAAAFEEKGISGGAAPVIAGRAAALGVAPAEVVAASYCNYAVAQLASVVPACWETISPVDAHATRLRGVEALYARVFGASTDPSAEDLLAAAGRAAAALAPVLDRCSVAGRPMYAGNVALFAASPAQAADPALQPALDLFAAVTQLREYRGDAHTAAISACGLTGLDALVLDASTGKAFNPRAARGTRGWSEADWQASAQKLADAGLLTEASDAAFPTEEGQALRDHLEALTHVGVEDSWAETSDEQISALFADAKLLSNAVLSAGVIPQKIFGHGSEVKKKG